MKRSGRASVYAVRGESYTLAERIYCRGKHGRDRKQHYLSKQSRRAVDNGKVDGVKLGKIKDTDLSLF
jgi:hypothetical protein